MIRGFGFKESATDELGLFFNQDGTDSKHFKDFKDFAFHFTMKVQLIHLLALILFFEFSQIR